MPAEELTFAAGIALRLLGAFYALGALFGLRRQAMDMLLTRALAAIARPDPREVLAETRRAWILSAQLMLVGVVGLALMALLDLALPMMLASAGFYALYLFWFSPRFLDPFDPPEEPGRGQTWRAFWLYLGATAFVVLAGWGGVLRPLRDEAWPVLAAVALLAAGLVGYGTSLLWRMHNTPALSGPNWAEEEAIRRETEYEAAIREVPLILSPSWNRGPFFDACTREDIHGRLPYDLLPWEEEEELDAWMRLFQEIADIDDPCQCRFLAPDGPARMEEMGRPLFERLAARMPPGRIAFEPVPWPRLPRREATAVKLMAEAGVDPLWIISGDVHEPIPADVFGLSWSLTRALFGWQGEYDGSIDWDDPGGPPLWDEAEAAAHDAQGEVLAVRLARELAATGRGHVAVTYWSERRQAAISVQG